MSKLRTKADIESHPAVHELVKDADGYWIYLKHDYWCPPMECGTIHEYTIKECCEKLATVELAPDVTRK